MVLHKNQVEVRRSLLLVIRNGSDEMVCKADKEEDVGRFLSAINGAIGENKRKRQDIMEARAARGEVRKQNAGKGRGGGGGGRLRCCLE